MIVRKIDPERVKRLLANGLSIAQIATQIGCTRQSATNACHRFGIPLPSARDRPEDQQSGPALEPEAGSLPSPGLDPRKEELVATGGRYLDLARWAGVWGVSLTHARFEWCRLRLPLAVERTR